MQHLEDLDDDYVPYVPLKQRRLEKLHRYATQRHRSSHYRQHDEEEEDEPVNDVAGPRANMSLLDQTVQQRLSNAIPGILIENRCKGPYTLTIALYREN